MEMVTTTIGKNAERFMSAGKTHAEYSTWATQVGRKMHINKLDAKVCDQLGLYSVAHLRYRLTQLPGEMSDKEATAWLCENSVNPYELVRTWLNAVSDSKTYTGKSQVLNERLRPFPKGDFERFGDRNHLDSVSKSWFNKSGINLDVQLMEINLLSGLGTEITMEDVIDFVKMFRPGAYKNPAQNLVEFIEVRFKDLTSFTLKEYYVEHLINMCEVSEAVLAEEVPF